MAGLRALELNSYFQSKYHGTTKPWNCTSLRSGHRPQPVADEVFVCHKRSKRTLS